ncbi:MAG: hypothetical protein ACR2N1_18695 [Rubripirellula sp.]
MRPKNCCLYSICIAVVGVFIASVSGFAESATSNSEKPNSEKPSSESAVRGYRVLTEKAVLSSDFTQEVFDNLWKCWPEALRLKAEAASAEQRREMAFSRYGLTPRPEAPEKPLQYVVDNEGNWTMNCFSCHGGSVYGKPVAGAPNNRFALQTLTEEIRKTKFKLGKPLSRMDVGSLVIPLGTTNGTTNAVVFGIGLMSQRDEDLNIVAATPQKFVHHDMDAPAWWNFHKKPNIYIDGFAQKGHRGLMQFMMIPENGRDFFINHEDDFRDVYAYISSLRPPQYPGKIDATMAEQGRVVFEQTCAECHGTYGSTPTYPNRRIPSNEIGTDPVRLTALGVNGRKKYARSWFAHANEDGEQTTVVDPDGYVAPALDGIWASAPYFHNGSVPTLWHLLNPSKRPDVWRPISEDFDNEKVGLTIKVEPKVPFTELDAAIRRSYFDTNRFGKSNSGHDYPAELTDTERRAVLEYLKTL